MKRVFFGGGRLHLIGAATPAWAQIWGATADGNYFNLAGQPGYNGNVAVNIPLNWYSLSAQIDTGLHAFGSAHDKDFGGSFIWNDPDGEFRLAATGTYNHDILSPLRLNETPLGVGAEWYPTDWATIRCARRRRCRLRQRRICRWRAEDLSVRGSLDWWNDRLSRRDLSRPG